MRALPLILIGLIAVLQYPMWFGKGGWLRVHQMERRLDEQRADNLKLQARNEAMDAEVRDLKTGLDAIEERARLELGMIKPNEMYYQVVDESGQPVKPTTVPNPSHSPVK